MHPRKRGPLLLQIEPEFTRSIPFAAVVEDSRSPALPGEEAIKVTRVFGVRQAVSSAEDDETAGRRGTGDQKNEEQGQETGQPGLPPAP